MGNVVYVQPYFTNKKIGNWMEQYHPNPPRELDIFLWIDWLNCFSKSAKSFSWCSVVADLTTSVVVGSTLGGSGTLEDVFLSSFSSSLFKLVSRN